MSDTIKVCPECKSHNWMARKRGKFTKAENHPDKRYYCKDCGAGFDATTERERQQHGDSGKNRNVTDAQLEQARKALGIDS